MAQINQSSSAAAVASSVKNVVFRPSAQIVPRKVLIIGSGDPATEAGNQLNTPILSTSPEDIGSKTGFGFMLHRLAVQAALGAQGIETWYIQQPEGTATQSAGDVDFAGSTGVKSGTLYFYVAGLQVQVTVTDGDTADDLATNLAAEINADDDLPVTAAVNGVTTSQVDITAKTGNAYWGDKIDLSFNLGFGEEFPTGVTAAITAMTGGAGLPDIQDALDSLGTGDGSNENFFTDVIASGYGQDSSTLDAIANYVGQGNDFVGCYDKVVHRPFRALSGDAEPGSSGLSTLVSLGDGRKQDRSQGVIAVPDSQSHPAEIAAQAMGHMARINNTRAEQNYLEVLLIGIWPGDTANRWTNEYNSRDTAVKAGISPTVVKSGAVYMQNVVTFYHPDDVPQTSNGYRSQRNVSILQNILDNVARNFEGEKWEGISIVDDVAKVTNITSRTKARDADSVRDDLVALALSFEQNAWIYGASFTIDELRADDAIQVRQGGDGFDSILRVVLSGEGNILDNITEFDTSVAVFF